MENKDIPNPKEEFTRLSDLVRGEQAVIKGYSDDSPQSRTMRAMGLYENISVQLKQRHSGRLIVAFHGARIAMAKEIADSILVERKQPQP